MTIAEIIAIETARQDQGQLNVIHLLKEGDFYRAHDWSAWLMSVFPFGESIEKPLRVTAKRLKDGYIDAFVGFPASSVGKFVPNDGSVLFQPVSDTQIDITIDLPQDVEATYDNLSMLKENWKNGLPLTDGKKQRREEREAQEQAPRIIRFTDIIGRIVALPIEDMSPREAWETLRDLRRQISAMF